MATSENGTIITGVEFVYCEDKVEHLWSHDPIYPCVVSNIKLPQVTYQFTHNDVPALTTYSSYVISETVVNLSFPFSLLVENIIGSCGVPIIQTFAPMIASTSV